MSKYLTPAAYRAFDDGVPGLEQMSDALLARYIARAEGAIDGYVGFDLKGGGFEQHVDPIIQQQFDMLGDWGARKLIIPSPIVPVRNVLRIRIHISNAGGSANAPGLYAILNPGEVVLNNWDGYCEVIALTLTYSLSSVIWELGLNPPLAEWDVSRGFFLPYWGETLYDVTGVGRTFAALRQAWAAVYDQATSNTPFQTPAVPPLIYLDGVPQPLAVLGGVAGTPTLVAGTAYTSLPITALAQALPSGQVLVVNSGRGALGVTVTLSAPAAVGATTLTVAAFTPLVSLPAGTALGAGYAVNYAEGSVTFSTPQVGVLVTADYTATIPDMVRDATTDQVTYLLTERALTQAGLGGLEQVKNGQQQVRRSRTDDAEEDELCAKARLKLEKYTPTPVAGG